MKFYLYLFIIVSYIFTQHHHDHHDHHDGHSHHHNTSIVGQVITADTGVPIEDASVSLINANSKEIEVFESTILDGHFHLIDIHTGTYILSIEYIGFETWTSDIITISDETKRKDMGTIKLTIKSIQSDDVIIREDKEAYKFGADKIVYTPEKDIIASSGSAEDVLQRIDFRC